MAKTVVGLFDTVGAAQNTVQSLVDNGIPRNDISLVANNARGEYTVDETASSTAEGAATGAVGGGVLGGVLGLLVGIGALAIPGIGPVVAAGPIAAALGSAGATALVGAGIGAVSGGLLGALVGAGVPEEDANFYAEGVRRGGTLVMARVDDSATGMAYNIMRQNGAVDIEERGAQWRESGWERFDPNAGTYDARTSGVSGGIGVDALSGTTGLGATADMDNARAVGGGNVSYGNPRGPRIYGEGGSRESWETYDNNYRATHGSREDTMRKDWEESSKAGTATGTVAGAATGAAIGSVGGPVGTVVGGMAGAATGAAAGAAGDAAGEAAEDAAEGEDDRSTLGDASDNAPGRKGQVSPS